MVMLEYGVCKRCVTDALRQRM